MATGWSVLLTDYFPLAAVYDTALKRRLQISVGLKSHVLYKVFKIEVHKSCNLSRLTVSLQKRKYKMIKSQDKTLISFQ